MAESWHRRWGLRAGGRAASAIAIALAILTIGPGAAAFGASGSTKPALSSTATTSSTTTTATGSQTSTGSATSPTVTSFPTGASAPSSSKSSAAGSTGSGSASTKPSKKATKPPAITPLTGWLGGGTTFPARAIVLSEAAALTPGAVSLSENGSKIPSFGLTRMTAAGPRDFGLVFVVDQTMDAQTLSTVMAAIRAAVAHRAAGQQLGLVTLAATPTQVLGLTSSQASITAALSTIPSTATGADLPAATSLALGALAKAKVALGAVVVISDGAGASTGRSGITSLSLGQQAASIGAQVVTVGIDGPASNTTSLSHLQALTPGQHISATSAHLTAALKSVVHGFAQDYVLRYRSAAKAASHVSVTVGASAVPGGVSFGYRAPGAPPAPATPATQPVRHHHPTTPSLAGSPQLSPTPSFAPTPAPAPGHDTSFWASSTAVLAVAATCSLLFGIALALALYRPSRRAVRMRVGSFVPAHSDADDASARTRVGLLSSLQRGTWWPPFVEAVEISRSPHSPIALVRRAAAVAVVVAAALLLVSGSPLAAFAPLLLWPFALRFFVNRQAEKQRAKFRDMLPSYLQDLASAIRVGRSFVGALAVVGESADEPTRGEFERAVTDEALGRPLEESLEAVSRRMRSSDMDQVALIASLNRRSGANVAESLDRVAEGSRDRADLRREIKALTAQAKMSSMVLTALPGVLLAGLTLLSPQYSRPLFHTTMGLAALAVGFLMVGAGWKVMQKITRVEA